ncbi:DUF1508 domain-containing protein [Arthrobacter sp. ov118]|uniref:DUF1508 domain-containing protein n=1 Tax=Arthrobacter sp. ov118 TaxID=1761747 RepID=UPI0008E41325|nr:hypothetical protein [Arthrobacter sp. ov118]SFT50431.1 Uncharacterized conserved protein YegP, UPF0339 family [Arthrobacter sp. ov118]
MAGYFELVNAPDGGYRIRMVDGAGSLMAVSVTFPTKQAAAAGVAQAREIAGTGLIRDRSTDGPPAVIGTPTRSARRTAEGAKRSTTLSGTSLSGTSRTSTSVNSTSLISTSLNGGGPGGGLQAAGRRTHAHH